MWILSIILLKKKIKNKNKFILNTYTFIVFLILPMQGTSYWPVQNIHRMLKNVEGIFYFFEQNGAWTDDTVLVWNGLLSHMSQMMPFRLDYFFLLSSPSSSFFSSLDLKKLWILTICITCQIMEERFYFIFSNLWPLPLLFIHSFLSHTHHL